MPLPHDRMAIGCKWVSKMKHDVDGCVSRYKERLVDKGYAQIYSIDYESSNCYGYFKRIVFALDGCEE